MVTTMVIADGAAVMLMIPVGMVSAAAVREGRLRRLISDVVIVVVINSVSVAAIVCVLSRRLQRGL